MLDASLRSFFLHTLHVQALVIGYLTRRVEAYLHLSLILEFALLRQHLPVSQGCLRLIHVTDQPERTSTSRVCQRK